MLAVLSPSFLCPLLCPPVPEPSPLWAVYLNPFSKRQVWASSQSRPWRGEEEQKRGLRVCDCAGVGPWEDRDPGLGGPCGPNRELGSGSNGSAKWLKGVAEGGEEGSKG